LSHHLLFFFFFFFNDTATTEIYTLSLHDALPIFIGLFKRWFHRWALLAGLLAGIVYGVVVAYQQKKTDATGKVLQQHFGNQVAQDRKSTRLNSSHTVISYAVFCLKKKKNKRIHPK